MEGKQEHQFYDPLEKPVDHSVNDASLPMALSQNQSSLHPSPRSLDILPTKIPEHLRILLDTWHEKHGDSVPPPCATTSRLHADPNKKRNRQPSVFIHTSKDCEGIMIAKRYPTLVKDKTVLVCKCMQCKHPATIIMFWQRSQGEYPQGYYEWLGEESWEEYPSVKKIDAGEF